MKRFLPVVLICTLICLIVSCGDSSGAAAGADVNFAKTNLSGAVGVVTQKTGAPKGSKSVNEQQDLYKIKDDGTAEAVTLMNSSGNPVDFWGNPTYVIGLNDKYFVLTFNEVGTYYPPYLLVSVEDNVLICLNHESAYSHSNMDNMVSLASTEFINTTDNSYVYWAPPATGSDNMLHGTKLNTFNKNTEEINTVHTILDNQVYAISVGKVTSGTYNGKDAVLMYTTGATYSGAASLRKVCLLVDNAVIKTFDYTVSLSVPDTPFVFFLNNVFYMVENGHIRTYDMTLATLAEDFTDHEVSSVTKDFRKVCINKSANTSILYNEGANFCFFINGTTFTKIICDSTIADVRSSGSYFYVCLNGDSSVIKIINASDGTLHDTKTTTGFKVKSFIEHDTGFLFVGQNSLTDKFVRGHLSLEGEVTTKAESNSEFTSLTKVDTL